MQLLQHGANVHYVTNLPEASTALHEAVQRSHDGIVDLLLRYGANAFLENGRGRSTDKRQTTPPPSPPGAPGRRVVAFTTLSTALLQLANSKAVIFGHLLLLLSGIRIFKC